MSDEVYHALPDKYLLNRWRKDTKRRYTLVKSSYDDCRVNPNARRYEEVVKRCIRLAIRVSRNEEHVNAFFQFLDDFELKLVGVEPVTCSTKVKENVDANRGNKILSPHVVRGKGRPPTRRKVPMVEKAVGKRKKKRIKRKKFYDEPQNHNYLVSEVGHNVDDVVIPTHIVI
ncbi:hypothetical protein I3843_03G127300 [Carya illinoinensis]|nr:hypothetical protein I3843_03G127300 [Carya illinoinensis]